MGEAAAHEGLKAVLKTLQEFGYDELTYPEIQDAFEAWQRGDLNGMNVIHMMAGAQFDEYPEIFGLPAVKETE